MGSSGSTPTATTAAARSTPTPTPTPTAIPTAIPTIPGVVPTSLPTAVVGANLIVNGNAELGPGSPDDGSLVTIPGWARQGNFNVMQYQPDDSDYMAVTSPGPSDRGKNYFYGGLDSGSTPNTVTSASQKIDVAPGGPLFATGTIKFTLSAYLGGWSDQNDNAKLTIQFLSATGQTLGTASVGPVLSADRNGATELLKRSTTGTVPAGTVFVNVTLTMTKTDGSDNDGSADDLSLTLQA